MAADAGHIVNTSSVNGFWASLGPHTSHTAYAAAKFAVKGFTEALITDLRLNAPHIKVLGGDRRGTSAPTSSPTRARCSPAMSPSSSATAPSPKRELA